jgi:hypothetical protein
VEVVSTSNLEGCQLKSYFLKGDSRLSFQRPNEKAVNITSKEQCTNGFESNFEFSETPKASTPTFEKFEDFGGDDTLIIPTPPVRSSHRSFLASLFLLSLQRSSRPSTSSRVLVIAGATAVPADSIWLTRELHWKQILCPSTTILLLWFSLSRQLTVGSKVAREVVEGWSGSI